MQVSMFAGVDWGGHHHQLAVVDGGGTVVVNRRFMHDRAGIDELLGELRSHGVEPAPVAIERCEGILVEALQAGSHPVFPVSPRVSARARERYQASSRKDDRFDAFVLAETLRLEHERWRPLAIPSPTLSELRVLVRDRRRVLETQQAIESQLRATLEAYHPAAARLFSSVDRAITLSFVRDYPTPAAAARIGKLGRTQTTRAESLAVGRGTRGLHRRRRRLSGGGPRTAPAHLRGVPSEGKGAVDAPHMSRPASRSMAA